MPFVDPNLPVKYYRAIRKTSHFADEHDIFEFRTGVSSEPKRVAIVMTDDDVAFPAIALYSL
jgi:hypothetical protein